MTKNVKTIIKSILPKTVLDILLKLRASETVLIDLSLVNLIRKKELDLLLNPKFLEEELLLNLGLNNEQLNEFPEELYKFCGKGLHYWQYPNQFSKYLTQISKLRIESYLEIGVRHGGTFIITVEYLEKFQPLREAIAVDLFPCPSINRYKKMNNKITFMMIDSQSSKFENFIRGHANFDLVFIDGSHEETACKNDFMTVKNKANIVVFHDISSDTCPGVGRVWDQVKATLPDEFIFFEYTDQYTSVKNRTGKSFLGIGMAIKKRYLLKIGYSPLQENLKRS